LAEIAFQTVDVFTEQRFGGNPLAVITDARSLNADQLAAIAREFNYSESTFVLPPADPAHTAQVRIFTPTTEVPFAGHPNVGTAFVLASLGSLFGKPTGDAMTFEETAGLVEVKVRRTGSRTTTAITAPEPFSITPLPAESDIVSCAELVSSDIVTRNHPPIIASVGLPMIIAEVADPETLARARPDTAAFVRANQVIPGHAGGPALYLYTWLRDRPDTVQARMFAPLDNIPEDPATGSAAGALGGLLAHLRPEADHDLRLTVRQGVEMGRPSTIEIAADRRDGAVTRVEISGASVPVMTGTLSV